ncbi:hypothetical protein KM043_009935 [Ampulex compressa]|nr:hypothetical protein KM043_009935 [Ampulex compressa]
MRNNDEVRSTMGDGETQRLDAADVLRFEEQFREKIYELQRNTTILERVRRELQEMRQTLYDTKSQLENERRISNELRLQLNSALDVITRLEEEKMRMQVEGLQLRINYESGLKERDSLIEQANSAKIKSMKCKMKVEELENSLREKNVENKKLEGLLSELKCSSTKVITAFNDNLTKLEKEHQYLWQSCKEAVQLNKRLQTVGLCFHAIDQKNKMEIKDLQCKLSTLSMNSGVPRKLNNPLHPVVENLCMKLDDTLNELKKRLHYDNRQDEQSTISMKE